MGQAFLSGEKVKSHPTEGTFRHTTDAIHEIAWQFMYIILIPYKRLVPHLPLPQRNLRRNIESLFGARLQGYRKNKLFCRVSTWFNQRLTFRVVGKPPDRVLAVNQVDWGVRDTAGFTSERRRVMCG